MNKHQSASLFPLGKGKSCKKIHKLKTAKNNGIRKQSQFQSRIVRKKNIGLMMTNKKQRKNTKLNNYTMNSYQTGNRLKLEEKNQPR